ncbi:putative flap endonuclease-1-like 5' DNA nuclease [Sphingomonas faeni]|uniref:Putative flap endonuclease-1-like 5' DNA nuclease n=2 Tax=Sphingomonas faeni TaxID=185950 RepID=A0A2T5TZA2_9SPHN|nr:putative flap endonuclease-1-like 5' DNA nuclease [Sphingomonas faeni]
MGMNETSATSASGLSLLPDGIATLTAIHFTIIAVVAILVVIGLIWGIRAKRSRTKAVHDVIANAEEAGVPPEPVSAKPVQERKTEQSQAQTQSAPVPIAPPPASPQPAPPRPEPTRPEQTRPLPPVSGAPEQAPVSRDNDVVETPDRLADEPIAAASPLVASPATETAALAPAAPPADAPIAPAAPAPSYADGPVTQLKGLGPKVAAQLGALGVSTVGEMAALSDSEAQRIDAQLGNFTGRMGRDRWIEQARLLAAGDKAGFEAVFGKL